MKVMAIDPGTEESAWLVYDSDTQEPIGFDICENRSLLAHFKNGIIGDIVVPVHVYIEMIQSYGMRVGAEVFDTCVWIGRFFEATRSKHSYPRLIYRKEIVTHICGSSRAKDADIRQALIDRFGPGKDKAIGKKRSPGPLYGVKKDIWSALAIAVTASERSVR